MIVDKNFCMSSFLSFRYIVDPNKIFKEGLIHTPLDLTPEDEKCPCKNAGEIDHALRDRIENLDLSKAALLLSGGIDSGILASYMPKGSKAYTVHNESTKNDIEVERARKICEINQLNHVIVEVTWNDYKRIMDVLSIKKGYPVFGNDPQIYLLAKKIVDDNHDLIIFGDDADSAFGGYDQLLSKNWMFDEFVQRFMFVNPNKVLRRPVDMTSVFEKYRMNGVYIDFERCIKEVLTISTGVAYYDMFRILGVKAIDPYNHLKMPQPLDLSRIRHGDSKYLLRELYRSKYPDLPIPEKIPMARPMDLWMKGWDGPERDEFLPWCINGMTGEQKYNIYSLERFLNAIGV